MGKEKSSIAAKAKEIVNFNSALIESQKSKENYNESNNFLIETNLREAYEMILKSLIESSDDAFYTYKSNLIFETNIEILNDLFYLASNEKISAEKTEKILNQLIEIGLFKEIDYESLLNEYLGINNLDYLRLKRKNHVQGKLMILLRLENQLLSRLLKDVEDKKNNILQNEKISNNLGVEKNRLVQNSLRTKENFLEALSYLNEEVMNLDKLDEDSEIYKLFDESELFYTYALLISQCKLHKEVDLSIKIGRPAFVWRFDHLKVKLRRMHPSKDSSFYLDRINDLVKLRLLERVKFIQIDSELMEFVDEKERIKEPDLYIFPHIDFESVLSIDYNFLREIVNSEKYEQIKINESYLSGNENADKLRSTLIISEHQFSTDDNIADIFEDKENHHIKWDDKWKGNLIERVNYNLDKINSDFFEEIYKPINEYLINNDLKIFYTKILKEVVRFNNSYCLENQKKSTFYIDEDSLEQVYKNVFPRSMNNAEPKGLFHVLIEIGMFEKVSSHIVASELGVTNQELGTVVRNSFSEKFIDGADLYVLLRLNENVLKRIFSNIKKRNKLEQKDSSNSPNTIKIKETNEPESKKVNNPTNIDYSITESALDILIESEIEGNKVIINKFHFDRLIKAILGEVPDL